MGKMDFMDIVDLMDNMDESLQSFDLQTFRPLTKFYSFFLLYPSKATTVTRIAPCITL